jgi:hypothetical protein
MIRIKRNVQTAIDINTAIDISGRKQMAIQLVYSAASTSTAKLQVSVDGSHFADISGSSVSLTDGGGSQLWDNVESQAHYLKVATSGGTVTVTSLTLDSDA